MQTRSMPVTDRGSTTDDGDDDDEAALRDLLVQTSRSFAISIEAMPAPLRGEVRVAYLLCRVLDTIEDDGGVRGDARGRLFDRFLARLGGDGPPLDGALTEDGAGGALWRDAERVFAAYTRLPDDARRPIAACLVEMAGGMRAYAARGDRPGGLAIRDVDDLERYCYAVASTVGLMLDELFELRGGRSSLGSESRRALAIRFGLGLQLVNILKDVAEDAAAGRRYLPGPAAEVIALARAHLAAAGEYTLGWSARDGLAARRFCAVPLALAFATLDEIEAAGDAARAVRAPKVDRARAAELMLAVEGAVADDGRLAALFADLARGPRTTVAAPSLVDDVSAAIDRGTRVLLADQRADGSWCGTNDAGPLFTGAALALEAACGTLRPDDAADGVRYLRAVQLPDGSAEAWPFAGRGGHEATCFWYAGMRAAGVPDDDEAVARARRFIERGGGLGANLLIVRAFLAAAGVLDPSTLPPVPMLYKLVPGHEALLGRLFGVNALVPLHTVPPMIRALRTPARRGAVAAAIDRRVVDYLSSHQDESGSLAGVPFYTMLMAAVLRLHGVPADDDRVRRAIAFQRATYVRGERGLFVGVFHCQNWDTAHAVRVLDRGAAAARAIAYLVDAQAREPSPSDWQTPRPGAPRTGGWAWQAGNARNPDIDSTAVVLGALGGHARDAALTATLDRGAAWLLSMQNADGGFAAFSHGKRTPPPGALYVPRDGASLRVRVERWLAEHGDPSTADVTGRVLHGLGALGHRVGDPRIDRAIAFLRAHQLASGAWWGRWSINYLPATAYIVTGLRAVGVPADDPAIARAVSWMASCQNADGGLGETPETYASPELAGRGPSSVQVTAMVTWALAAAGAASTPAAERAVGYLLAQQRAAGGWDDRACYGVIFPHRYYYTNDAFPTPLALEALRAWRAAREGGR